MSWRTVVITKRCKLDLSLNYLEIRGEETRKIHLSEIHTILIDTTAVSLTTALLCELMHRKIKVIFCDESRNPQSELIPYYGSTDTSAHVRQQIAWDASTKGMVWAEIIAEKIRMQQFLLIRNEEQQRADLLEQYVHDIVEADASNREGHAAKVYFGGLFGKGFTRTSENPMNAALNYGYAILLSSFNKEIVAAGYLTQLGIFHDNIFNPFNLASDLMEPFRPLVDQIVKQIHPTDLSPEIKYKLVDVLNQQVLIEGQKQYVANAIKIYTHSVLDAMNNKTAEDIRFYTMLDEQPPENKPECKEMTSNTTSSALREKIDRLMNQIAENTEDA